MPSWGRPSGARQATRRKDRGVHKRPKDEDLRFHEIDSDSDDGQGVSLDASFASDDLYSTGADIGAHVRTRPAKDHHFDSESSEESNSMEKSGGTMQLALRDKEELLVQKALERIRRAQLLGKTNVKLSQPELDALERKRRKDESKRKTSASNLRPADKRRSSGTSSLSAKEQHFGKRSRQSLLPRHDEIAASNADRATTPPGLLLSGYDGQSYAPLGYYPSTGPLAQGTRPDSRLLNPSQQQQYAPSSAQHSKIRDQHKRDSSGFTPAQQAPLSAISDRSRRLPDDPGWSPRSRSASSNLAYPMDPYQYQQYSPQLPQIPPQYAHNRRVVSGPPDVEYPNMHYLSTRRAGLPTQQQRGAASSEPSLLQREYSTSQSAGIAESNDDSEDSEDYGVQVDVVPYGYDVRVEPERPANRQRRGPR